MKNSALLIIILSLWSSLYSQELNQNILIKIGVTEYGSPSGFVVSGGSNAGRWKTGIALGTGFEKELEESFYLQILFEASFNKYDVDQSIYDNLEPGNNSVYEAFLNVKKEFGFFFIIGGVGISAQKSTPTYSKRQIAGEAIKYLVHEGDSKTGVSGFLGTGARLPVSEKFSLLLEVSLRMRKYLSSTAQLGLVYNLK
ncbi:MAG: hypothetical protein IAE91_02560 [Ignavibacteriaceae bacterium]|nr:hypothetical protein [Ignavibacteriaceae bacterium]